MFIFLISLNLFPQKENCNWYFGSNCGITFNTPGLTPSNISPSSINTQEGCSVASDRNGNLLFYTDGITVFNKHHDIMSNGQNLKGNTSATQSSIIIPRPGSDSLYYVFTVNAVETKPINLHYSIVDIDKNSGLGEVINKNILLENDVTEKLTAVRHANGRDYWILAHEYGSNAFLAYLLNKNGIETTAVISKIGLSHAGSYNTTLGYLKASPDGKKLAIAIWENINHIQIADFDNATGKVSNLIDLGRFQYAYGVEFSPDGTKLYCSATNTSTNLIQFDLSSGNPSKINDSRLILSDGDVFQAGALQLGPDNRIYCAQYGQKSLGVIKKPNENGLACEYEAKSYNLSDTCYWGLPNNFKKTCPDYDLLLPDSLSVCPGTVIQLGVKNDNNFSYTWITEPKQNLRDSSLLNIVADSDRVYTLLATNRKSACQYYTSTKVKIIPPKIINIEGDDYICNGDSLLLSIKNNYYKINWSDGRTGNKIYIKEGGIYDVECIDSNGCLYRGSKKVALVNLSALRPTAINLGDLCNNKTVTYSTLIPIFDEYDLFIDSIYTKSSNKIELFDKDSLLGEYKRNQIKALSFKFHAEKLGNISDTIFISFSFPCKYIYAVPINGNIYNGDLYIWANDTTAKPSKAFCIPIFAKYLCLEPIKVNYRVKLKFNKQLFTPTSVESGKIENITENNGFYIVEVSDSNRLISGDTTIINHLCGTLHLGKTYSSDIELLDFNTDEKFGTYLANGSIMLNICAEDLRGIILNEPTTMTIQPNFDESNVSILIHTEEEGSFNIELISSLGNRVWNTSFLHDGKNICDKNLNVNLSDIGNGVYFIRLISPWNAITRKLIINK